MITTADTLPMASLAIFISYARRDGRDLALRLHDDLIRAGHMPWLDMAEIEGGASWSNAIEDAIEQCQVMLVLLTQGSFESEICRAEQLRGLRKKKKVIPLLCQYTAERPLHLESLNYRDFSDPVHYQGTFSLLLQDILSSDNVPLPEIYRTTIVAAPSLPPHFVTRAQELERLRSIVIGDNTDQQIALTALRGMGGIGKSVLATALCHDEIIQAAFPDGVVWVTIGKDPGNLTEQMKLIGTRLGDAPGHYTSEAMATDRLRTLLAHKAVLIVLDDVWDARHVSPFRFEARRCRTLFTTRDGAIALAVGASEVRLGTLSPDQSMSLLEEWSGRAEPEMKTIAERLGHLPLALKLAGARLREGMRVQEWLSTFQHVSQMKLGRRSIEPHENLEICFDLSVQQLGTEDQLLYHTFGVFPEDVAIPQSTVVRLWRYLEPALSEYDAIELIVDLARLALIDRDSSDQTITLHDLLHDYTRVKLGTRSRDVHQSLLYAYNPTGIPWHQVPHDGYLYYQLGYHLFGYGQHQAFFDLLLESPDWMEAKFIACQGDHAYVADLDFALKSFSDPLSASDARTVTQLYTARQIINVRINVYTDLDLATLVWLRRKAEAVNHARLRIEAAQRFDGLFSIYTAVLEMGDQDIALREEMLRVSKEVEQGHLRQIRLVDCARLLRKFNDDKHIEVFRESTANQKLIDEVMWIYQLGLDLHSLDYVLGAACFSLAERLSISEKPYAWKDEQYTLKTTLEYEYHYQYLIHMLLELSRHDQLILLVKHIGHGSWFRDFRTWLSEYQKTDDIRLPNSNSDALIVKLASLRAIDAAFKALDQLKPEFSILSDVAEVWVQLGEYDALVKLVADYFPWEALWNRSFTPYSSQRFGKVKQDEAQKFISEVFARLCSIGQPLQALRIVTSSARISSQIQIEELDQKIIDLLLEYEKADDALAIVYAIPEQALERKPYWPPVKVIIEAEKYVYSGQAKQARQLLELAATNAQDRQLLDLALEIFRNDLEAEQAELNMVLSKPVERAEQAWVATEAFDDDFLIDDDLNSDQSLSSDNLLKFGIAALRLGHKRHARAWFLQAVKRDPQSSRAWHWLALVMESRSTQKICIENAMKRAPHDLNLQNWLQALDFIDSMDQTKMDSSHDTIH